VALVVGVHVMNRNTGRARLAATSLVAGLGACYLGVPASDTQGVGSGELGTTNWGGGDATGLPGSSEGDGTSAATHTTTAPPGETAADDSSSDEASSTGGVPAGATPENLRVAFFGDHGLGPDSVATLQLVLAEDADFLIILGDFDYKNDPAAWHEQLDEGLGEDFPMFAVAGNHDASAWDGYREVLMDRLTPIADVDCQGEIGVQMNCLYKNVDLVLSGVGTMNPEGKTSHVDFISETLAESESIWKICAWHKNQHDMQLGGKNDEVGWAAYQACQGGGAIVATGHEHTYARTKTLTKLGNHDEGHGAVGEMDIVEVGPGRTFVFVSGMGGNEIRDFEADHEDDTWWATQYTSNVYNVNGVAVDEYTPELGVLFIDFHVDGDPYKARGYFKNLAGEMIDEFTVFAEH
jgi:Calcineurin-like phosphoesterase